MLTSVTMESVDSAGVKGVSLSGRLGNERERLIGMTEEERAFRMRFLKSQNLAPEEPLMTKEIYREYYNPIRRAYKAPLNVVEKALTPLLGKTGAFVVRNVTSRAAMAIIGIYCGWYYFKYHKATWLRQSGWKFLPTRSELIPGTKGYKAVEKPSNFGTYGFENSPI